VCLLIKANHTRFGNVILLIIITIIMRCTSWMQAEVSAPRAAQAAATQQHSGGDDNGFWDKKVEVRDLSAVPVKPGFEQQQPPTQQQQQQVGESVCSGGGVCMWAHSRKSCILLLPKIPLGSSCASQFSC
jgi:hypothetical protein